MSSSVLLLVSRNSTALQQWQRVCSVGSAGPVYSQKCWSALWDGTQHIRSNGLWRCYIHSSCIIDILGMCNKYEAAWKNLAYWAFPKCRTCNCTDLQYTDIAPCSDTQWEVFLVSHPKVQKSPHEAKRHLAQTWLFQEQDLPCKALHYVTIMQLSLLLHLVQNVCSSSLNSCTLYLVFALIAAQHECKMLLLWFDHLLY